MKNLRRSHLELLMKLQFIKIEEPLENWLPTLVKRLDASIIGMHLLSSNFLYVSCYWDLLSL